MNKLSVLIFTKNDVKITIDLIESINYLADDIVLVTGNWKELAIFEKAKKKLEMNKLRIFYVLSLGYSDPSRAYGMEKCKYNWILHLDVDERLSDKLKEDIKRIIANQGISAYALKRLENPNRSSSRGLYTWQVRLFRKDRTTFNGVIHNLPDVKGKTVKLENASYYLIHKEKPDTSEKKLRYLMIEAYSRRLSYRDVLALMHRRNISSPPLRLYLTLMGRDHSKELTMFDYKSFLFVYSLMIWLSKFSKSSYVGWGGGFRYTYDYNKAKIKYFFHFTNEDRQMQFDISQSIVKAGGIIKYLGLDQDGTIQTLNSRYNDTKMSGAELLIFLLKKRHADGKNYLKRYDSQSSSKAQNPKRRKTT